MFFQKIKEQIFYHPIVKRTIFFLIYFLSILLLMPHNLSWYKQTFFLLYAFFIFWILDNVVQKDKNEEIFLFNNIQKHNKFFVYLLIFSVFFLFITRLLPFLRFGEAPLGYDTGFYLYGFEDNQFSLLTKKSFYLNLVPLYHLLKMPPLLAISFIYILSQFLIIGSLYILFRSMKIAFNFAFASIAVFLFSLSITQFQAYWWMFGQQMLATSFLFITIALFFRYPLLALLTGCVGILFHFQTLIIFGLSSLFFLFIYAGRVFLAKKSLNRNLFYFSIVWISIFFIGILIQSNTFLGNMKQFIEYRGLATNFPYWEIPKMKGLFIDVSVFRLQSLLLIPFALFGFLCPRIWAQTLSVRKRIFDFLIFLYITFLGLFILVCFPFIYQHRFMILFDLFLIIFATPAFFLFINYFFKTKGGQILLGIFLVVFLVRVGIFIWAQEPQLFPDELKEIKALAVIAESDARVLATNSLYTPWVMGFSKRIGIGPGMLPDSWNLSAWIKFWGDQDGEERLNLLYTTYSDHPLYIFMGRRESFNQPYQTFIRNSPHFTPISPHVWKYKPEL